MPTIKINKWDCEEFDSYLADKWDKVEMIIHVNGQRIPVEPSKSEEKENWECEHTFKLDEDVTDELGEWKHIIAIRVNGKTVEKYKVLITNPEDYEEDNED